MSDFNDFLEHMKTIKPEPFRPFVFYNEPGDMIEVYLSGAERVCHWISPELSVMKDRKTGRVVGVYISGIKKLLDGKAQSSESARNTPITC